MFLTNRKSGARPGGQDLSQSVAQCRRKRLDSGLTESPTRDQSVRIEVRWLCRSGVFWVSPWSSMRRVVPECRPSAYAIVAAILFHSLNDMAVVPNYVHFVCSGFCIDNKSARLNIMVSLGTMDSVFVLCVLIGDWHPTGDADVVTPGHCSLDFLRHMTIRVRLSRCRLLCPQV